MRDDKYIVFKREDWERGITADGPPLPLDDAVVIRRQDVFAPPALDGYANSITVALEATPNGRDRERLQAIADYFHAQAKLSWDTPRKIPD